jgi:hypothetical protein
MRPEITVRHVGPVGQPYLETPYNEPVFLDDPCDGFGAPGDYHNGSAKRRPHEQQWPGGRSYVTHSNAAAPHIHPTFLRLYPAYRYTPPGLMTPAAPAQ